MEAIAAIKLDVAIPLSHRVQASVGFLRDLKVYAKEKPYYLRISKDRPSDSVLTNIVHEVYDDISLTDIRGYEDTFTLDVHGFQIVNHQTCIPLDHFHHLQEVQSKYIAEMESFLKSLLGAGTVRTMQCIVRERGLRFEESGGLEDAPAGRSQPIPAMHQDSSKDGAIMRIRHYWPLEAEGFLGRRFQIINVWRPLVLFLRDWPLFLCDARSIKEEDMVASDIVEPGYQSENLLFYFNPTYKLYFIDKQCPDEVWLFKQFDSVDGVNKGCPHGSFRNPRSKDGDEPRKSVEIAVLVVY